MSRLINPSYCFSANVFSISECKVVKLSSVLRDLRKLLCSFAIILFFSRNHVSQLLIVFSNTFAIVFTRVVGLYPSIVCLFLPGFVIGIMVPFFHLLVVTIVNRYYFYYYAIIVLTINVTFLLR